MIIGFSGKAGSGKDTAADYLIKNEDFIKISFAQPIKEAAKILFNLCEQQVNGDQKNIVDIYWQKTPRQLLQILGTDMLRDQFDKQIFVKLLEIQLIKNKGKNIVITDVRFNNEQKLIHKYGGCIYQIFREQKNISDDHSSENQNLVVDGYLNNNKDINSLHEQVQRIFRQKNLFTSKNKHKKYALLIIQQNGNKQTVNFGQFGASDYTINEDQDRKKLYINRHIKREQQYWTHEKENLYTASYLSRWLLWNEQSLQKSIDYVNNAQKITIINRI